LDAYRPADAIDIVMVVDGKTSRGDRSRLDSFLIYGQVRPLA
jgi:hypothetical protein